MVAERRFSTPENYAYLALLFSLLRPELQGYLKIGQDVAIEQAISSLTTPYNLTGLAFSGTLPYQSHGVNVNNLIYSKEALAASGYYDPLSQYINWQPNAQFSNNGTAMILADTQVRSQLGSFGSESGYSSGDEIRSPLSPSSFSSNSSPLNDLSTLGATGYTPTTSPDDYVHSLEDYVDLEALANVEPTKGNFDLNQDLSLALKQEPDYLLEKLLGPDAYYPEYKTSPDSDFSDDFGLGLGTKDFDQFFDIDQTVTNSSFQYPLGSDLESVINFDALDSLDFNLPPDVLTVTEIIDSSNNIQSQLQDLIQNPVVSLRNGSGSPNDLTSVTVPDNSRKPVNIPTKSTMTMSNKKKFAVASKTKTPATTKKLTAMNAKSMKSSNLVGMSDDDIIQMSVNEFNTFLESLAEEQAKYVRDVRRRGKNKEAARVCRKRKLDAIDDIDDALKKIKLEKQKVLDERRAILEETAALKSKINELEESVLSSLQDDHGNPLSRSEYSLLQASNGTLYLGKNIADKKQKEST